MLLLRYDIFLKGQLNILFTMSLPDPRMTDHLRSARLCPPHAYLVTDTVLNGYVCACIPFGYVYNARATLCLLLLSARDTGSYTLTALLAHWVY